MKKFLERYPWVQQAGCGVLICALLLSICLPLMGMRSAEPDNPILQAAPQRWRKKQKIRYTRVCSIHR